MLDNQPVQYFPGFEKKYRQVEKINNQTRRHLKKITCKIPVWYKEHVIFYDSELDEIQREFLIAENYQFSYLLILR